MKHVFFVLLLLLLCVPGMAQIARVSANCTGTSSCTTTGNATGDLEIAIAGRDGSSTAPTTATGWTSVGTATINGTSTADSAIRVACKVATGANEASNTFTNADKVVVMVYNGQAAGNTATCASAILGTPSFFTSTVNTTTTTETFNAITSSNAASWIVGLGYCSACTAGIGTAPTGMANRSSVTGPPAAGGHDTNGTAASFSSANVTLTTAGRILTATVEIKAASAADPTYGTNGGTFGTSASTTSSTATGSATLCYTTDGSTPAAATAGTCSAGSTYSSALTITTSGTTLKALATKSGLVNSAVVTSTAFTINRFLPSLSLMGISGPGNCTAGGHTYTTAFPTVESPLSECLSWLSGAGTGLDWSNINVTSAAVAKGSQSTSSGVFDDSIAQVVGTWSNDQEASATTLTGTTSNTISKEHELLLRFSIGAHSSTGYEFQFIGQQTTPANCSVNIVKWNGTIGSFTTLGGGTLGVGGSAVCLSNGTRIRATAVGTTLTAYVNDAMAYTVTDATYASGNPGIGTYLQGVGGTQDFGFSSFSATDTVLRFVQEASHHDTSGTTSAATLGTNTTNNNCLWAAAYWNSTSATATVAGSVAGSFTAIDSPTNGAGALSTYRAQAFYKCGITGGAETVTLTTSTSLTDHAIVVHEFSGVTTLDQHPSGKSAASATLSSNSATTTTAREYLPAACVIGGSSPLATSPWTARDVTANFGGNISADYVVTATGSYAFAGSQSPSSDFICLLSTFQ